jgi:hypothetical protein
LKAYLGINNGGLRRVMRQSQVFCDSFSFAQLVGFVSQRPRLAILSTRCWN